MANIPKLLYRKPGILRSVYGREEIGLRDQEFELTVQQRNFQTNEPIIVSEVFGTPGVQRRQPPINYFDRLIEITGQVKVNDEVIHGSLICWYEKDTKQKLIKIDSSTLSSKAPQILTYLMRDSIFPVLMTKNHQPLACFPRDYTTGIFLGLMRCIKIPIENRTVLIVNNRKDIKKTVCSTHSANLICYVQSIIKKRSGARLITYLLNGYQQSVIGLHAALNQPIDQKITIEFDRMPDWNHRLTNRYMFLVGNDGYLCISENWSSNSYTNSLLKENTYFLCDGYLDLVNTFAGKFDLIQWIPNIPYRKTIHIIPEGVQYIHIMRNDCQSLNTDQIKSYIYGWYTVSDYDPKVLELDSIQLSADLLDQPNPVHDYQPVMILADINDALIYEFQKPNNQEVVGHILFSLSHTHNDKNYFEDIIIVFICLDETNWSTSTSLYQIVGECRVQYQQSWIRSQLTAPKIIYFDQNSQTKPSVNMIELSTELSNRWRKNVKKLTYFAYINNWLQIYLPFINTTPVNGWLNVGVNLPERQRLIQIFDFKFPKDYGVFQKPEKN